MITNNLLREPSNQSAANLKFLCEMAEYWENSPGNVNSKLENFTKYVSREALTKFLARNEVFLKQINTHGSIVELGVARGASLMTWFHLSSIYEPSNYSRRIIGFDTFTGFPGLDPKDFNSVNVSKNLKNNGFLVEPNMDDDIKKSIKTHDRTRYINHIDKVEIIKGDIIDTLPKYINDNPYLVVSLLHIDVDIYQPTIKGLEILKPRIPKGGVILFDEINSHLFPGETEAINDTLGLSTLRLSRLPYCPSLSYAIIE